VPRGTSAEGSGSVGKTLITSLVAQEGHHVECAHFLSPSFFMNSQPARFGELLSSAWAHFRERQNVILIGAVIFTVLGVAMQVPMSGVEQNPAGPEIAMAVVAGIIGALVGMVSSLYFMIAVVRKETAPGAVLSQVWPRVFPFIGLSLLTMLKTYGWIAVVGVIIAAGAAWNPSLMPLGMLLIAAGIVCGVIFGPRYMLAGILWLVEGKSVRASVDRSYQITAGYWGKIVGNIVLVVLIFLLVMFVAGIVAGIAGGIGGAIGGQVGVMVFTGLVTGFISQCYSAFMNAFLLKLTATIVTNPRNGAAAAVVVPSTPAKKALKKPQATMKKSPAKKTATKKTVSKKKKA